MPLTGQQLQKIRDALLDAYPTRETLVMMLRVQMNEHLEAVANGENLRVLIFNLVSWAERAGRVDELIHGAYSETPGNAALKQLVDWWSGLSQSDATAGKSFDAGVEALHGGPASIDVFLSYSRKDSRAMTQVREALSTAGLSVWTDDGLEPGTPSWQTAIAEAVRQASAMVVLLSPNSNSSTWVHNEIVYAQTLRKRIVPVLISGDETNAVPISLITAQRVDSREEVLGDVVTTKLLLMLGVTKSAATPDVTANVKPPREAVAPPSSAVSRAATPQFRAGAEFNPRKSYRGLALAVVAAVLVGMFAYYLTEHYLFPPKSPTSDIATQLSPDPNSTGTSAGTLEPTNTSILTGTSPVMDTNTSTVTDTGEVTGTEAMTATGELMAIKAITDTSAPATSEPTAGAVREFNGVPFVYVPAGEFTMGSNPKTDSQTNDNEQPQHTLTLPGYWIMRTEVTNGQYKRCVEAGVCTKPSDPFNERWNDPAFVDHPVTDVTWHQANAYALWAGGRLPTEAEWEKACRGTVGRIYPWGDSVPTAELANYESNVGDTTSVGKYSPQGDSPYGLVDMAGNVFEWTSSQYKSYPYEATDGRENPDEYAARTLRGGGWSHIGFVDRVRCARRDYFGPNVSDFAFGFRLVSPGF